ncbi:MAG: putative molybdenum carrier protein [Hyphomonadaceae bacterium]|nr:putative molybdenum carrier protein [Hyphomonadaceae bacterium]
MDRPRILVSGGQTGVDRGVLRFAVEGGFVYRGWTPAGGWAEDLPEPPGVLALYPDLRSTESADPDHRTSLNIEESDAVLILTAGAASPGTAFAQHCAATFAKPVWTVPPDADAAAVRAWLSHIPDLVALTITGPTESEWPGAESAAVAFLQRLFS